jgi:hypothetical protein
MRPLPKPTDDPSAVFLTCISNIRTPLLKERLTLIAPRIAAAAILYESAGATASFHAIAPNGLAGTEVTQRQMVGVYNQRMARKNSPGRPIYDRLKAAAPDDRCPLCGQGVVSTLDHHLPEARYPELAVTPLNLVPACSDCNRAKHNWYPLTAGHQTLHPYFDDLETDIWLRAHVIEESPAALKFFIDPPAGSSHPMQARVKRHFEVFRLALLYGSHSASELSSIGHQIRALYLRAGPESVRSHLDEERISREAANTNSWQAATYRALVASDWYCAGGSSGL